MARRIVNRMEKRAEHEAYEAAERRRRDDSEDEADEEEGDEEEEAGEAEEEGGDEEEEEVVVAKKPKKAKAKPRVRTPKVVRMKVVWGVFSNSNQRVATYEYPKRREAEEHAARLAAEKKSTFFVQPVKEAIEEKKEA